MSAEEFSFPIQNFPSGIESPRLWCSSPTAASACTNSHDQERAKEEEQVVSRSSSCSSTASHNVVDQNIDVVENININDKNILKERSRRSFSACLDQSGHDQNNNLADDDDDDDDDEDQEKMDLLWQTFNEELYYSTRSGRGFDQYPMVESGRAQAAFKLSTATTTRNTPNKTTAMVMLFKVLKKLFLLHNSSHHPHHHRNKLKTSRTW